MKPNSFCGSDFWLLVPSKYVGLKQLLRPVSLFFLSTLSMLLINTFFFFLSWKWIIWRLCGHYVLLLFGFQKAKKVLKSPVLWGSHPGHFFPDRIQDCMEEITKVQISLWTCILWVEPPINTLKHRTVSQNWTFFSLVIFIFFLNTAFNFTEI